MAFKIYTKTGDKGATGLIGGTRVLKSNIRIEAYGTIDELNSHIGLIKDTINIEKCQLSLGEIQDRLFTIGAILATDYEKNIRQSLPDLHATDITFLENAIDEMDEALPEMKTFVLPGGHVVASYAHIARCVCRRSERLCVQMQASQLEVPSLVLMYLNRLSDYLFALARYIVVYNKGIETPWRPRV